MSDQENEEQDEMYVDVFENDHLTDTTSYSDGSLEDLEAVAVMSTATGQYDRDIPTTHGYLGKLNPLSGYTLFEDGQILKNTFAIFTNTLVFPGFTLPLVMGTASENQVLEKFLQDGNRVFILLCVNSTHDAIFEYGITMEIVENITKNRMMYIKARGRQRCQRVPGTAVQNVTTRISLATVKILAEPPIVSPLEDTLLIALKNKRNWKFSLSEDSRAVSKYRRYHASQFPWSCWIYDLNEVERYTKILLSGLKAYGTEFIPTDPEKLSYWFVQNYHLSHTERLQILKLHTTLERLKLEVMFFQQEGRKLCCSNCLEPITEPKEVFAMSKDGTQANYVNPGGQVYETITVLNAYNYELLGSPSKLFSWFPGYAWTIMQCYKCRNHLGWKFNNDQLTPKEFFGLAHSGTKVVVQNNTARLRGRQNRFVNVDEL